MLLEISSYLVNSTTPEPIEAFIWFWPIVVLSTTVLVGTIYVLASNAEEVEGKTLGVLGMREAGKTQLYRTLQKRAYDSPQGTSTEDYESFTFKYGDREIKIEKGRDIGGGENYIREYYEDMIKNKDIIFFVFNADRYIDESSYAKYGDKDNKSYAMHVQARMDLIWRKMKEKYGSDEEIRKHLVTVGSHLDKIPKSRRSSLLDFFQQDVFGKPYCPMFHENFFVTDLTDHDKLMNELISKKIFG